LSTEWGQFRNPDFKLMRRLIADPVIFDGRNLYEPRRLAEAGFTYHSIDRQTAPPGSRRRFAVKQAVLLVPGNTG
jgi:UDPglucose 6-dehydrogenase